jgi:menaquinone reductase, multiheme cytochrome c subunit
MCRGPTGSAAGRAGLWAVCLMACEAGVNQPIAYNHKVHVKDLQMSCDTCHEGAVDGVVAGLPGIAVCADCHAEPQGKSAEERKVVEAVKAGREPAWVRLYGTWQDVFFSHRRHVKGAGLLCERCHGDMGSRTSPPPAALVALTMTDCLACHRSHGADTDCVACHR